MADDHLLAGPHGVCIVYLTPQIQEGYLTVNRNLKRARFLLLWMDRLAMPNCRHHHSAVQYYAHLANFEQLK